MISDKFQVVEYHEGRRVGEVASGMFHITADRTEAEALALATSQLRACRYAASKIDSALNLTYAIERVTVQPVAERVTVQPVAEEEPGAAVTFNLTSSVRSAHLDGPWLLLFAPEVPDGWAAGRMEVTARGGVQLEIRPKRGGAS